MSRHLAGKETRYEGRRKKKLPLKCRLGLHGPAFQDTSGREIAPGVFVTTTKNRCNDCLEEVW